MWSRRGRRSRDTRPRSGRSALTRASALEEVPRLSEPSVHLAHEHEPQRTALPRRPRHDVGGVEAVRQDTYVAAAQLDGFDRRARTDHEDGGGRRKDGELRPQGATPGRRRRVPGERVVAPAVAHVGDQRDAELARDGLPGDEHGERRPRGEHDTHVALATQHDAARARVARPQRGVVEREEEGNARRDRRGLAPDDRAGRSCVCRRWERVGPGRGHACRGASAAQRCAGLPDGHERPGGEGGDAARRQPHGRHAGDVGQERVVGELALPPPEVAGEHHGAQPNSGR